MVAPEPSYIGRVRHVLGSQVTVELDPDLAGVAPLFEGQLLQIGQIGSLVRIPQGIVDVFATVTLVGIAELSGPQTSLLSHAGGDRWLQVQLLGETDLGTGRFQRGVGSFPALDDAVHFAVPADLASVFPGPSTTHLRIGRLSAAESVPIALNASALITRHSAVVGSTGAGKSTAVASILQNMSRGHWTAANIVVVDTHGEYAHALGDRAAVRSVLGETAESQLQVPYWALPSDDILTAFAGSTGSATTSRAFASLVIEARREFVKTSSWLDIDASAVTADTPVPFDLHAVWHGLDSQNNETRELKNDASTVRLLDNGDAAALRPARFAPYGPAGKAPHQGPTFGLHGSVPELLRLGLLDPRLAFLRGPVGSPDGPDPLERVLQEWLGLERPVSVLDFSGVPARSAELAIGVILQLIFETAVRGRTEGSLGKDHPVLVVLEEAHRYLGDAAEELARSATNRIAREGRKYGVGLMLVTQRPSELPETALAQCGTLISLRLSNASDQGRIRSALPDSVAGLAEVLPSLRTGEAIVSGEGVVLPARVLIDRADPLPLAEDPTLSSWQGEPRIAIVGDALANWRGIFGGIEKGTDH